MPAHLTFREKLINRKQQLTRFIYSPQIALLLVLVPYLAAQIIAAIAYTVNAAEGQDDMQSDWHQLNTLVNTTIPALIVDFCCNKNTACDSYWCADCSRGGDGVTGALMAPELPASFTVMHKILNAPARINYTPYANFGCLTTFIPVMIGGSALLTVYLTFYTNVYNNKAFAKRLSASVVFTAVVCLIIYPFIFFTDFSSLSGARYAADQLCDQRQFDPALTVPNPFRSSSLFLSDFYQHLGPGLLLLLTLLILMTSVPIVGLTGGVAFRKKWQGEAQALAEEGMPLLGRGESADVEAGDTRPSDYGSLNKTVAAVDDALLVYQKRIEAIEAKDPTFLLAAKNSAESTTAYFFCSISNELMYVDPVQISTGRTFERSSILNHFASSHTDPLSRQVITDLSLRSCVDLRGTIRNWIDVQYRRLCSEEIEAEAAAAASAAEAARVAAAQAAVAADTKVDMEGSSDEEDEKNSWVKYWRFGYRLLP